MDAFKHAWESYPSQDNEGYKPDRGAFKCGWFAALEWKKKRDEEMYERSLGMPKRFSGDV